MNVTPVSKQENKRANYYKSAAVNGAVMTTALLGLSTTIDYFFRPQIIKNTIERVGGTNQYIKKFIGTAAVFSAIGAVANTTTAFIMEKLANRK